MRMLALPAAFVLSFCVYLPLPRAAAWTDTLLRRMYAGVMRLFTRRTGRTDDVPALCTFLLLLAGVASVLAAVHPVLAALTILPLFTAPAALGRCAQIKDELDSGKYARNIPGYEALVRTTCASLPPVFVCEACAPALLCAVGLPLHLGAAPGLIYAALRLLGGDHALPQRIVSAVERICDAVLRALFFLCAGAVGGNPLRMRGGDAQSCLLSALSIGEGGKDARPPMSGDISQAIFLCLLCTSMLVALLTALGFLLC